jgi:hypothetical protein
MQPEVTAVAPDEKLAPGAISAQLREQLAAFLTPLLTELDRRIDLRLVRTFLGAVEALLSFRHRNHGLLLSELGAYLASPDHAPAGTKRLSNLLRSPKWAHALVSRFLWRAADTRVAELQRTEGEALLLWDESVVEKPESRKAEGLGSVRSSKAARLQRIKPGFYQPPGGRPISVPGFQWLCLLVLGQAGPPVVAVMRWWSNRQSGRVARKEPRQIRAAVLRYCARQWGRTVLHIWDRGYAGSPWLGQALHDRVRFVMRWPKGWHLEDATGKERPAWQMTRGLRNWDEQYLRDPRRNELQKVGVLAVCLKHPDYTAPLWLVVARSKGRPEPWYLLTNEPIETEAEAWRIVRAYARRWQVEMSFRYGKSELAMESPRLWTWERRMKLLLLATLAYAFLLSLLQETLEWLRTWLLRHFCHRTGKRARETPSPLYRLRSALSRLWLAYPALPPGLVQNPG